MAKHRFMRSNFGVKSYHRWEAETLKQYGAFVQFRSLNSEDRDFIKFAEDNRLSLKEVEKWSDKFDWLSRARAFDEETERQIRWKKFRKIEKMNDTQASLGMMCQGLAIKQLRKLMAIADATPDGEITIGPKEILQMAKIGADLERLSRGEATEIHEEKQDEELHLDNLSTDELIELQTLKEKARKKRES